MAQDLIRQPQSLAEMVAMVRRTPTPRRPSVPAPVFTGHAQGPDPAGLAALQRLIDQGMREGMAFQDAASAAQTVLAAGLIVPTPSERRPTTTDPVVLPSQSLARARSRR
jgi:hypothetical protein